nr:hypothetical protein [Tanacetum cinerariifolium]
CGHPVDGSYRQGCALLRKKLEEDLVTYFQNFQNTSESSDGSTNVVNAPREPFIFKQDHSVTPPHNDECCCECGDALDGIFCQQCTCKSCGKGAMLNMVTTVHLKFRLSIRSRVTVKTLTSHKIFMIFNNSISVVISVGAHTRLSNIPACCDDDDDYNSAITPVLSTEEPDNSLSMGDEHLDTISTTESDEVIRSSVEDLVPIPSEFEGIPDTMCDVHLVNNPTPLEAKDHFEIIINSNDDISSSDDDSLYNENIEYVEASPHDSELVSLEFPPTDRSDFTHEEFADELAYILSPPEYDCFYFRNLPNPGELISILNSGIHENLSTTRVNLPVEDDHFPLLGILGNVKTLAKGFYPLSLHFLSFNWESRTNYVKIPNSTSLVTPTFKVLCNAQFFPPSPKNPRSIFSRLSHHSTPFPTTSTTKSQQPLAYKKQDATPEKQSPVIHQPPQELSIQEMEDLKQQYLDELKRLNEVIKSSVEDLVLIPSEFEGIPDTMCDVHFDNNHTPLEAKYQLEIVMNSNDDISSSDDDSLHEENIEYVEESLHDSELVSLEAAEIVIPEVEEIEDDNL